MNFINCKIKKNWGKIFNLIYKYFVCVYVCVYTVYIVLFFAEAILLQYILEFLCEISKMYFKTCLFYLFLSKKIGLE